MLLLVVVLLGLQFRVAVRARAGRLYAAMLDRVSPQPAAPAPAANPAPPEAAVAAPQASAAPPAAANEAAPVAGVNPPSTPDDNAIPAANEKPAQPVKAAPDATEDAAPKEKTGKAAKYTHASHPNPSPAKAVSPEDDPQLRLAQKYIHGQGVRADCTTGMAYLREAMKRPSAAAASQMGALYATGTWVPLYRVAAYRWFTSAMQMAPSNAWLARERDELYGQMSSAERRRADQQ